MPSNFVKDSFLYFPLSFICYSDANCVHEFVVKFSFFSSHVHCGISARKLIITWIRGDGGCEISLFDRERRCSLPLIRTPIRVATKAAKNKKPLQSTAAIFSFFLSVVTKFMNSLATSRWKPVERHQLTGFRDVDEGIRFTMHLSFHCFEWGSFSWYPSGWKLRKLFLL